MYLPIISFTCFKRSVANNNIWLQVLNVPNVTLTMETINVDTYLRKSLQMGNIFLALPVSLYCYFMDVSMHVQSPLSAVYAFGFRFCWYRIYVKIADSIRKEEE